MLTSLIIRHNEAVLTATGYLGHRFVSVIESFVGNKIKLYQLVRKVNWMYLEIDIFFLPSLYEGLPMVILEAMASRTPVISMDVGGISEVIVDNYSGFLVEEKNYAQFISKIIELKNDVTLRSKFSSNAFEIISNNFDIQKYCENVEKIYKNFI